MKRYFVLTESFERQLSNLSTSADLLADIEQEVFRDLDKSLWQRSTLRETGGFTKIRVSYGLGKRGGLRVIYLDSPLYEVMFLVFVYSKSGIENISESGKMKLKKIGEELKLWQPKK